MASSTTFESLVLLHLSDIHFRKGIQYDLDEDIRKQLESDCARVVAEIGKVDAILVTGDIAFSGDEAEYAIADSWLADLSKVIQCSPLIVYCVPGNHDVNRKIYDNDYFLAQTLDSVARCEHDSEVNEKLGTIYQSTRTEEILFEPLRGYNVFASQYGCEMTFKQPSWSKVLQLENGPKIRINGLNSALGSRAGDRRAANLFLGLKQLQIPKDSGVINVTLCHHPPEWLLDFDQTELYLARRAHLQLFGHKHVQRFSIIAGQFRVSAGAVHPERREKEWIPRYNFIKISPESASSARISIYPRVWHEDGFVPDYNSCGGSDFVERAFETKESTGPSSEPISTADRDRASGELVLSEPLPVTPTLEAAIIQTSQIINAEKTEKSADVNYGQILIRRYLSLNEFQQTDVLHILGLDEPSLAGTPESGRLETIFSRAIERKLLKMFWELVEERHSDGMFNENPFDEEEGYGN